MKFRVSGARLEELTLDEAIALEEMQTGEQTSLKTMKGVMARFLVDDKTDAYVDYETATKRLGSMTIKALKDVAAQFSEAVKDGVLPPESGGS